MVFCWDMARSIENTTESFDQTSIWYRKIGNRNPKLVLCDGVGCDGFIWKYLISHFQKKHGLIHWNYRGHGKSAAPKNMQNLDVQASVKDLQTVIKAAGARAPVVLLGHSMGVQVILDYYHHHPKRVLALVILCGSCGHAIDHIHDSSLFKRLLPLARYITDWLDPIVRDAWQHLIDSELGYLYASAFEINPELAKREDFEPYLTHLSRMDPVVFLRMLEASSLHTAEPYLQDIKVPTLIVAGEKDRFTPFWLSERLHEMVPGSSMLALPEGTHVSPIELPEVINQRIEQFLADLSWPPSQNCRFATEVKA